MIKRFLNFGKKQRIYKIYNSHLQREFSFGQFEGQDVKNVSINITEECYNVKKIKNNLLKKIKEKMLPNGKLLRLSVKGGGKWIFS